MSIETRKAYTGIFGSLLEQQKMTAIFSFFLFLFRNASSSISLTGSRETACSEEFSISEGGLPLRLHKQTQKLTKALC